VLQEYGKGEGKGLNMDMGRLPTIAEATELCTEIWVLKMKRIPVRRKVVSVWLTRLLRHVLALRFRESWSVW
jgi:hypothetical protein